MFHFSVMLSSLIPFSSSLSLSDSYRPCIAEFFQHPAQSFYTMVKNQVEYDETLWAARDSQTEKRLEAKLKRQAKQLGYELIPIEPQAA